MGAARPPITFSGRSYPIDLNRLYFLHQLALIRSASADGCRERNHHNAQADTIALRITEIHDETGAHAAPLLPAEAH